MNNDPSKSESQNPASSESRNLASSENPTPAWVENADIATKIFDDIKDAALETARAQKIDPETLAYAAMEANRDRAPTAAHEIEIMMLRHTLDATLNELERIKSIMRPLFNDQLKGRFGNV